MTDAASQYGMFVNPYDVARGSVWKVVEAGKSPRRRQDAPLQ
jgi:hypothetical protein